MMMSIAIDRSESCLFLSARRRNPDLKSCRDWSVSFVGASDGCLGRTPICGVHPFADPLPVGRHTSFSSTRPCLEVQSIAPLYGEFIFSEVEKLAPTRSRAMESLSS